MEMAKAIGFKRSRCLIDFSLIAFICFVLIPQTELFTSVLAAHQFKVTYYVTSFSTFFSPKQNLQSIARKNPLGIQKTVPCCPQQHLCSPGPHFPFQSLNLSPFFYYAFSPSHFNELFQHILKYTSPEDTTVCSASNIFITFYYKLGSREVLHLIWRTCPVSFIFLQDFYWVNLIQLSEFLFVNPKCSCYSSYFKKNDSFQSMLALLQPYHSYPQDRISFRYVMSS